MPSTTRHSPADQGTSTTPRPEHEGRMREAESDEARQHAEQVAVMDSVTSTDHEAHRSDLQYEHDDERDRARSGCSAPADDLKGNR